jgi:hypothetical protein
MPWILACAGPERQRSRQIVVGAATRAFPPVFGHVSGSRIPAQHRHRRVSAALGLVTGSRILRSALPAGGWEGGQHLFDQVCAGLSGHLRPQTDEELTGQVRAAACGSSAAGPSCTTSAEALWLSMLATALRAT